MKKKFDFVASVPLNNRDLFWLPTGISHLCFWNGRAEYWTAKDPKLSNQAVREKGGKPFLPLKGKGNCFFLPEFGYVDKDRYHYGRIIWFSRCRKCKNDLELKLLSEDGTCPRCITVQAAGKKAERMISA